MRRFIAVSIVTVPLACQVVTGDFSVGAGGRDSGGGGTGDAGTGLDATVDGPSNGDGASTQDVTADGAQGDAPAADAALEAEAEAGPVCVTDLSGVGTGDFHVSFDMETDAQTFMALVNQRSACSAGVEWDIFMQPGGGIEIETDDGIAADRVFQIGGGPVNDGQPHHVEAARVGGQLWVQTDSTAMSQLVADTNDLTGLPPLVVGTDPGLYPCGGSPVAPLSGTLTDLCVTRSAPPACLTDLSNVGTGDFEISFTLTTTNTTQTLALVNQRANCACLDTSVCSSPSTFWDVTIDSSGGIIAVTDDDSAASYVGIEAGNSVNDGQPHKIVVARTSGMLWYSKDGVIGSAEVADAYSFGTFPALTIGSDVCSTTTPLVGNGTLTDLCITTP